MTSLNTTVRASITAVSKKTLDGRDVVDHIPNSPDIALAAGTGYGKADIAFSDQRTLATNTSETLDLTGTLVDGFGATIAAVKVKAIEIESVEANTTNLTIGGGSNPFLFGFADVTDLFVLKPGDKAVFVSRTGWPVTAATGDLLKVLNAAGASAIYNIKIIAASA